MANDKATKTTAYFTAREERRAADGTVEETVTTTLARLPAEPAYVKLYVEDVGRLLALSRGEQRVLLSLACSMAYDGLVSLSPTRRARLAQQCGLAIGAFNNALYTLTKQQLVFPRGRGEYELHPELFARGEWNAILDRQKRLKLEIKYTDAGRQISMHAIDEEGSATVTQLEAERASKRKAPGRKVSIVRDAKREHLASVDDLMDDAFGEREAEGTGEGVAAGNNQEERERAAA